jgi:hypothetical protein
MDITFTPDDPEIGEVEFTLDNEAIASNVIFFPKRMSSDFEPPQNREQLHERIREEQVEVAIDIATEVLCQTLGSLQDMGFNIRKTEKLGYDAALMLECIKALIMRRQGNEHPLHDNLENIIPMTEFGSDPMSYYNQFLNILEGGTDGND